MNQFKTLGLAVAVASAVVAFVGVGNAAATTLRIGNVAQNKSIAIEASLASGTSAILKDEFGTTTDTCTTAVLKEATESPFTGESVSGKASALTYSNCTHTTTVLAPGRTVFIWIPFTNNATVFSVGTEVTVMSTFFGASATCKTGSSTHIGTLTGALFGRTTMHYNAKINCGILGSSSWTGTYTITSPEGLNFVS